MSISSISSQVADLSLADKLSLIETLVASIRKEGNVKKKGSKAEKDKPKRKAALGTLAWGAYVKHIKATQPDAFEGITKESEKLVIIKGIRADDPDGYKTFTEAWKAEHSEPASETASVADAASVAEVEEAEEEVPAPAPPKKVAPAPKVAPTPAPKVAPTPAPKVAPAPKQVKKVKASE